MLVDDQQQALFDRCVAQANSFVVTTHMNPDGDALGSQLAVARYLLDQGKQVTMINGDPAPEVLEFITEGSPQIEIYDAERHDALLQAVDRVILVDNSAPDRLGRMERGVVQVAEKTLCIDHHPTRQAQWADSILNVQASATAALVWDLLIGGGWEPDATTCQALFVGLATDTGFFRFNSTTADAHRIASELLSRGVHSGTIYRRIYERNSESYTRLLGRTLDGMRLDADGAIASATIPLATTRELQAHDVDTGEITSALLALEGVQIVLLFRELDAGKVKVSLRSKGAIDVHLLALIFGGGGHRNASGIVLEMSFEKAVESVISEALKIPLPADR